MAKQYIDMQPTTWIIKAMLEQWNKKPKEQREAEVQKNQKNKVLGLMVQAKQATPEWLEMVGGLISPPFLPSPPMEALWPLFIQGQLGYNMYFYMIGEKTYKDKEGNTKANKLYIEGGQAGLLEKEMRDMIDPNFAVGQF